MKKLLAATTLVLLTASVVSGCTGETPRPTEGDALSIENTQGTWVKGNARGPLGEIPLVQDQLTKLTIDKDGMLSASVGCNNLRGPIEYGGDTVRIGPLASTRMACDEKLMDAESKLIAALEDVNSGFAVGTGKIYLDGPKTQMTFLRAEDK